MIVGILCVVAVAIAYAVKVIIGLQRKRLPNEPPTPVGNTLFGNAVQFQQNAVKFLLETQKRLGDIFQLRLITYHINIIMDPHLYDKLATERNFDFDKIQEQVNRNVFGFKLFDSKFVFKHASKMMTNEYLVKAETNFANNLTIATKSMVTLPTADGEYMMLRDFCSRSAFEPIFTTVFGRFPNCEQSSRRILDAFDEFHHYFNYLWLGMNLNLMPNAKKAYATMCEIPIAEEVINYPDALDYLRFAVKRMMDVGQSHTDLLGHNLVYLHVNYNTCRMLYWANYFLLTNPAAVEGLKQEIQQHLSPLIQSDKDGRVLAISKEDLMNLKALNSFINETFRLCSGVFMIRHILNDTTMDDNNGNSFFLRQGDKIAIYPPALHMNKEIFADPETFQYDRFVDKTFYYRGKPLKNPVMPFGSRCPGKRLALDQAKLYMISWLLNFHVQLLPGEATSMDTTCYGHEILPPTHDVRVAVRPAASGPVAIQWLAS